MRAFPSPTRTASRPCCRPPIPPSCWACARAGWTAPTSAAAPTCNGGGLLYAHTGMYGMFALQEGVRQMRGTAPAQVDGARTSLVLGVGGMFSAAGAVVLRAG